MDRIEEMNFINSTWNVKLKQFSDGSIKIFKGHFYARVDQRLEDNELCETYAPVTQWTTVFSLLILEVLLYFKSSQSGITASSLHADLE